jgi:endoglucanase
MIPDSRTTERPTPPADPRPGGNLWRRHRRAVLAALVAACLGIAAVSGLVAFRDRAPADEPTGALSPVAAQQAGAGGRLARALYVDPESQAAAWLRAHPDDPAAASIRRSIAHQPTGKWFGAWSGDITTAVDQYVSAAAAAHKVPVLVAYNLPERDCGGQSAGGMATAADYARWIRGLAAGIAGRPALVVLEPDGLAQMDSCLSSAQQQARLGMLSRAVSTLQSSTVSVYLDAGHANWVPAPEMAQRLDRAGIRKATGFSLNVSNFDATDVETAYGRQINDALDRPKPFIVDTSRNGNGSAGGEWCNPAGRKLGATPRRVGAGELLLWVKAPGESDGDCGAGTGTSAGQFVPRLAMDLIRGR